MHKNRFFVTPLVIILLLASSYLFSATLVPGNYANAAPAVLYAAPLAQGTGDCLSWANACTLQTALGLASNGNEIWVKAGAHFPGSLQTDTFTLKSGVALYGGFTGDETARDERDWEANPTILSGDIDHNDTDPEANYIIEDYAQIQVNNAYHVVTGTGTDATAILDGFIITAGQANAGGWPGNYGGGMFSDPGSPTLTHLIFCGNYAGTSGGALLSSQSNPILTEVVFSGNNAASDGGAIYKHYGSLTLDNVSFTANVSTSGAGGAIFHFGGTSNLTHVTFTANRAGGGGAIFNNYGTHSYTDVTFTSNIAAVNGGGIYGHSADMVFNGATFQDNSAAAGGGMFNYGNNTHTFTNVIFSGNTASGNGGGLYQSFGFPVLTNVVFHANTATHNGGGLYMEPDGIPVLTNVTFAANEADYGGGFYNYDEVTVTNAILWGNSAPNGAQFYNLGNPPTITYSLVEGGYTGTGNLDADPLFLNPDANLRLGPGSAAIDVGDIDVCPAADLDGVTRPVGLGCDMGAYEMNDFTVEVNKSASAALVTPYQLVDITVTVTNTGPGLVEGVLSDPLPAGLLLSGSVLLDPPDAGVISTLPDLAEDLTISTNQTITVTFSVSIDNVPPGTLITNTATFAAPDLPTEVSDSVDLVVNSAPVFTSTPLTTAAERNPYSYAITVDDPDLLLGDTLTITAATLPEWLTLTDHDDNTASLTGTPLLPGDYLVEIVVTDLAGAYTVQDFTITVEPRWFTFLPMVARKSP